MPYSEQLNLVHVAIPKTGTSSVVAALHSLHEQQGGKLTLLDERVNKTFCRRHGLTSSDGALPARAKHLSAEQLRIVLGDRYTAALVFTFVRNPWARMVSRYRYDHVSNKPSWARRWLLGRGRRPLHNLDFDEWLRKRVRRHEKQGGGRNQIDRLMDAEGRLIIDYIGKLESIQEDFNQICERIGSPPVHMPQKNTTGRGTPYADYYNDWSRNAVADLFQRDIEAFNYTFGS